VEKRSCLTLATIPEIRVDGRISVVLPKNVADVITQFPSGVVKGIGCPICPARDLGADLVKLEASEDLPDEMVRVTLLCAKALLFMYPPQQTYGAESARHSLACGTSREFDVYVKQS
jgi:hypothetical protein